MCILLLPDLSHQAWCDADLHKNNSNKDSKSQHFEKFAAEVAQLEASIADLTEQFAAAPSNSEVNAQIEVDETAVRKEHGLKNAQTVPDTVARVEAVQKAVHVLEDSHDANSSLHPGQPLTKYVPRNDSRRGIIDLLEVIEADFT